MILAAGLTPAWQQILAFDSLRIGEVNRAREAIWCASGKVCNVGIALHHLGVPSLNLSIVGGLQGDAMVEEFDAMGVPHRWIRSASPTRSATTILDRASGSTTELVQNAEPIAAHELGSFLAAYREHAADAEVVVLIGSLPAGTPRMVYADLAREAPGRVILDASGTELLDALPAGPFCVKPNREELSSTLQRRIVSDGDLKEAMSRINSLGAEWVVVSQGGKPLWASSGGRFYTYEPPRVEVVNPIGSGDCLAAGIAVGLYRGMEMTESIRLGIAASVDNAGMLLPARLSPDRVERLFKSVMPKPQ
jgi:tagatose 6-phosphate kinase